MAALVAVATAAVVGSVAPAAAVAAPAPTAAATDYPRAAGRCVDQVGVLGRQVCAKVTAILMRDERATSDEIAVAIVPTTGERGIEDYSTGLFNTWGVGKRDKNNGVLLVVAVDDRRLRLETGRGMADRLTDGDAGEIVDGLITPHFANNEYALGILAGLDEVRRRIGHAVADDARLEDLAGQAPDRSGQDPGAVADGGSATGTADSDRWVVDGDRVVDGGFSPGVGDTDDSLSVWPFAVGGMVLLGMLGIGLRALSQASGSGAGAQATGRWAGRWSDPNSASHTTWSTHHTHSSTSSFSDSGTSGSSFGGGSSDGGGSSGSW